MSAKTTIRVTDLTVDEQDDGPIVTVAGRGTDGKRYVREVSDTEPYFFIPDGELEPAGDIKVRRIESGYTGYDGTPLRKIITVNPSDVKAFEAEYPNAYENDIPYTRRVSVDAGLSGYVRVPKTRRRCSIDEIETDVDIGAGGIDPRILIADIETIPPVGGDFETYIEEAPEPVIMITAYDTQEGDYSILALDPENDIEAGKIRGHLEDHWADFDKSGEQFTDATLRFRRYDTEEDLLNGFICTIEDRQPDLLSGWNWVDFDHRYLINRIEQFDSLNIHRLSDIGIVKHWLDEIRPRQMIDGLPGFDMMSSYDQMTMGELRSKALDYVSEEELGVGKMETKNVATQYEEDRTKLLAYNVIDVQLTVALDNLFGIHEFFFQIADLCGVQTYDTFSEMRMVDGFILSRRTDDEILPSTDEQELGDVAGGYVLETEAGISEWVGVLDIKSLYPSSIITMNMSPETMTDDPEEADVIVPDMPLNDDDDRVQGKRITEGDIDFSLDAPNSYGFSLDQEGIVPKYLRLLFETRNAMKAKRDEYDPDSPEYNTWDIKQVAVKVIMNSAYGVLTTPYYRLSKEGMGDAVTGMSRYVTWTGIQTFSEMGYESIVSDTDSVMVELANNDEALDAEEAVSRLTRLETEINDRMDSVIDAAGLEGNQPFLAGEENQLHGTDRQAWVWEAEKLFERFLSSGKKKRYAGRLVWKEGQYLDPPKTSITGFEAVRSDSPVITEEAQTELLERVLAGQGFDEVSEYFQRIVTEIREGEMDITKIGIPGVLNKPPEEYPNRPVPRACMYTNDQFDDLSFAEGDQPWVYWVEKTPIDAEPTDVIALPWNYYYAPDGYEIDTGKHIEKYVHNPIKPILSIVEWEFAELASGRKTNAVGSFTQKSADPFGSEEGSAPENPF